MICVGITGSRYQLTVCEEDTIYTIQKKFFETFPEEFKCNSTWRKDNNLVRVHVNFSILLIISE